jgi:hypothetical protein
VEHSQTLPELRRPPRGDPENAVHRCNDVELFASRIPQRIALAGGWIFLLSARLDALGPGLPVNLEPLVNLARL